MQENRSTSHVYESYESVQLGECEVKISKYYNQIQVFLFNYSTAETAIHWFDSEYEAVMWIEYMTQKYV